VALAGKPEAFRKSGRRAALSTRLRLQFGQPGPPSRACGIRGSYRVIAFFVLYSSVVSSRLAGSPLSFRSILFRHRFRW